MNYDQAYAEEDFTFLGIIWRYKYHLALYTMIISCVTFTVLYIIDGVPDELRVLEKKPESQVVQRPNPVSNASLSIATTSIVQAIQKPKGPVDLPERVIIDKIGVDTEVSNPTSADNAVLNNALLKGAVRYPGSGTLGQGNVFLFGHSTGIRVVNNQAYKAFNHLNNITLGDTIRVQSATKQYTYKVTSISLVDSSEELVDFSKPKDILTLSTCNVFGEKQERYVVEAVFVKSDFL